MSIWKEIKDDYSEDMPDGTMKTHIDAWETEDDNEEGKVIATVQNGVVTYIDERAKEDKEAQEVINIIKDNQSFHLIEKKD